MFTKKPGYVIIIGILFVIVTIISYQLIKFDFYEENIISKIKVYNKNLEKYFIKLEKLDSLSSVKFRNYNFKYLEESNTLPTDFGNDYSSFFKWLKDRSNKIKLLSNQIDVLLSKKKSGDSLSEEYMELIEEGEKLDSVKKIKRKLFYSQDDLEEINKDADEKHEEVYNKKK